MKNHKKVVLLVAAVMLILSAVAFAKENAEEPAKKIERRPRLRTLEKPDAHCLPFLRCEEFREEMKRHREAMAEIMKPVRELRRELAAAIKELRQEYFPKPEEGEKRERPDPDKVKEFMEKVNELVKKFQDENEKTLKKVLGKAIDERITHHENLIKIAKDNKDKIVEAHWRKLLVPPRIRERLRRFFHHKRWWRKHKVQPVEPVEPAEE